MKVKISPQLQWLADQNPATGENILVVMWQEADRQAQQERRREEQKQAQKEQKKLQSRYSYD